jgi:hypothetical protein
MIFRGIRNLNINRFSTANLYNRRFADKFKDAYVVEPLVSETNTSKDKRFMDGDFGIQGLNNLFERKIDPAYQKYFNYASRMATKFETIFLPSCIAIGLIYWPYHWSIKVLTMIPTVTLSTRAMNKCQEPESPETYIREMLHTHSKTKDLFDVDTTQTIDHWIKWD